MPWGAWGKAAESDEASSVCIASTAAAADRVAATATDIFPAAAPGSAGGAGAPAAKSDQTPAGEKWGVLGLWLRTTAADRHRSVDVAAGRDRAAGFG